MNDSSREFSTIFMNDVEYDMVPMESKLSPEDFMSRGEMEMRQEPEIGSQNLGVPYGASSYGTGFPFGGQFMGGPLTFPQGSLPPFGQDILPIGEEASFYEEDYGMEVDEWEVENREPKYKKPKYKKKEYYDDDYKDYDYKDIRRIVMKIQRYNPGIFRMLMRYGMPYYEARRLVRRIVRLALIYGDD